MTREPLVAVVVRSMSLVLATTSLAFAEGPVPTEPGPKDKSFNHALQFGLRTSVLGGYRMVFRYDDSPLCTTPDFEPYDFKDQQKFCGHMGPGMLDVAASFAVLGTIEPYVMGRFGFVGEGPTNTKPLQLVGAGARIYTSHKKSLKFFIEPTIGIEFEEGAGDPDWTYRGAFDPDYKTDVVFRAALGPQLDLARGVGLYLQVFGMSVGVLRYIHATLEFGGGVQVRFP